MPTLNNRDVVRRVMLAAILLVSVPLSLYAQRPVPKPRTTPAPKPAPDVRLSEGRDKPSPAEPQDAPSTDKWATVYGQKIHYIEAGSGPVVILVHGLGGDLSNWAPTIGPLSQKYRVIALDQIGFGKSDKPLINYRVGTLVDFLDGFYKQLGITRASLVGNSLGGWAVAAYTLAHPEKVDRLVLVDAAGFALTEQLDPRIVNGLNPSTRDAIKQVMSLVFYNSQMFATDAGIDAFFTRRMSAGDGYTIQRFIDSISRGEDALDNQLAAIKQPTLVVWGKEDGLTPLAMGERFKKEIPGSEIFVIQKCGHVPQLEKPAEFNSALLKFLDGAAAAIK
jgi:2-hydroxy-6-oxonona-2,4-dienedioate hydrolase